MTDAESLAELIQTRLIGVRPEDQDVVLEDEDWELIVRGLRSLPADDLSSAEYRQRWSDQNEYCQRRGVPNLLPRPR